MFTNAQLVLFKQPDPIEKAAVERRLGRPLSAAEFLRGKLDRGQPGFHDRIPSTKLAGTDISPIEKQLADAKRRLAEEEYQALSPAARAVRMLEDLKAADAAKAAAALAHEGQQKLVAPLVEKLDQLLEANRYNPDYSLVEWETLVTAREQLLLEGGDPEHSVALFREADAVVQAKEDARKTAAQKKLEELVAMKQQIESELGITNQSPSTASASSPLDAVRAETTVAMNAYRAAKAAGVTGRELNKLMCAAEAKFKALEALKQSASPPPTAPTPAQTTEADIAVTGGVA